MPSLSERETSPLPKPTPLTLLGLAAAAMMMLKMALGGCSDGVLGWSLFAAVLLDRWSRS